MTGAGWLVPSRAHARSALFLRSDSHEDEAERHEEAKNETSSEAFRGSLRQSTCSRHFSTWNKWQLVQRRLAVATLTL